MFNISIPSLKAAALSALVIVGAGQASALTFDFDVAVNPTASADPAAPQFALKGLFELIDGTYDYSTSNFDGGSYHQEFSSMKVMAKDGASLVVEGRSYDLSEYGLEVTMRNLVNNGNYFGYLSLSLKGPVDPDKNSGVDFAVQFSDRSLQASDLFGEVDKETALALLNAGAATIFEDPKLSSVSRGWTAYMSLPDGCTPASPVEPAKCISALSAILAFS